MLRQDDPFAGRVPPPRALPIRYVLAWKLDVLAWKVERVRRRVRAFRRTHDGIGWALVSCVVAVGVGFLVGHY